MTSSSAVVIGVVTCLSLAACGGGGSDGGGNAPPDDSGTPPSHAAAIQPIWDVTCVSGCHEQAGQWSLLLLDANAYDDIVGVPSTQVPTMNRVEAGQPSESYLWHKVRGTQATVGGGGVRMPPPGSGDPLSQQDQDALEAWILGGASP